MADYSAMMFSNAIGHAKFFSNAAYDFRSNETAMQIHRPDLKSQRGVLEDPELNDFHTQLAYHLHRRIKSWR